MVIYSNHAMAIPTRIKGEGTVRDSKKGDDQEKCTTSSRIIEYLCVLALVGMFSSANYASYFCLPSATPLVSFKEYVMSEEAGIEGNSSALQAKVGEYIMWSNEEAYYNECRARFLNNLTWGQPLRPYVEKVTAKHYARAWSPDVAIIPTLATYDESNLTDMPRDMLMANGTGTLSQPYIIKSAHTWGGIASVQNDTFRCFRGCFFLKEELPESRGGAPLPLNMNTAEYILRQLQYDMERDHSVHGEMQYHNIMPRIMVEEMLDMSKISDVAYWYTSGGQPIFVSIECPFEEGDIPYNHARKTYSPDFVELPVYEDNPICHGREVKKPKMWDRMHKIAKQLGSHLQDYVVRIDLYSSDDDVFFRYVTCTKFR